MKEYENYFMPEEGNIDEKAREYLYEEWLGSEVDWDWAVWEDSSLMES